VFVKAVISAEIVRKIKEGVQEIKSHSRVQGYRDIFLVAVLTD